MRRIGLDELQDLAVGATVLGTGGGGDPFIGRLMAEAAIARHGPVTMITVDELPEQGLVVPAAMMGAPTVMLEKIPNGQEMRHAVRHLEQFLSQRTVAILTAEAGGINSMIPLAVAAELGLPVVDADGMGRAFPELQMTTFHIHGIRATPMVIVDEKGNVLMLNTVDNHWTERLARTATVAMGGATVIAAYPMSTQQVKEAAVPGTLSLAMELGRLLRNRSLELAEKLRQFQVTTRGRLLFHGKVVDVFRRTTEGFARGTVTLAGMDEDRGRELRVEFQNEHLMALRDGEPVAMVPDLIAILDRETLTPITTETLAYGQRAVVLGMPSAAVWRSAPGLETVGPRYFGYDYDFIPVEALGA
jgi:DUF917 family protein